MNTPVRRVTKADVAKFANVSHMTVTRALTGSGSISAETKERVLNACRALGYTPDLVARSLCAQKSCILGLLTRPLAQSYFARMISAAEQSSRSHGYQVLMAQAADGGMSILPSIQALFGRRVDGLLVAGIRLPEDAVAYIKNSRIPTVFMDSPGAGEGFAFVGTNDREGGYTAASYLIKLGHTRLAFIAGSPESYTSKERICGYRAALLENGIEAHDEDIFYSNYQMDGGSRAAEQMLSSGRKYTAIICGNDYVAVGAVSCIRHHGLRVPEDFAVVGFSGDELGEYSTPPLTTMYQPAEEIGRAAVDCMIKMLEGSPVEERTLLAASLLVRESA
jgi:LacI family transcriptional regulator